MVRVRKAEHCLACLQHMQGLSGAPTCKPNCIGRKEEGKKVRQPPHNSPKRDGDVARCELVRQRLALKVAIHPSAQQEQQVCKDAQTDC